MKLAPGTPLQVGLALDETELATPVGRLAMSDGLAQLEWSADTIENRWRIDPLLYPPEPGLQAARGRAFDGLPGFLADSLPDAWGRLLMKRRLEKLGIRMETLTAIDRLALVGTSGRGALVYEPTTTPADDVDAIDLDALAEQSYALLLGDEGSLLDTLALLGGASGGARPKIHIGLPVDDAASAEWIVKFRAIHDPVDIGPVEEAYARMARAAGIAMAESRIIPSKDGYGWFASRRFDRPFPGRRLHMVSLAGAIEAPPDMPTIDYDGFLRATMAITRHADDLSEAFRRMVFNVLAYNRDDHSRQHSYLMGPDSDWRLAPAYDLTFSAGPGGEHYMAIEGEGRAPTRAHVSALGRRHGLSARSIAEIIDMVRAAIAEWPRIAKEVGVHASRTEIDGRLAHIAAAFD
ncbi:MULTISPECIES: type II toxin-antitoxin system HipA family toxin [unclassified Sphingomonas]|uniref:type II toxin-antitoxin system HipA family toxin n=1 Tax=unclassified Sphingomonas TaxID=196159 RepID=UPI000E74B829|nr:MULTISPECIES: type II toxin-antitoxin system HipA family toxin [unclassified Sphingomonas]RKE45871.1 serine/threonine-protein kinase HipA [Sphingomonas sp. PP-CC-1A-547]TCM06820.1 serine/threonine-protein kinase HipA [Sphingomonas sp. PP-CC-3G-468]